MRRVAGILTGFLLLLGVVLGVGSTAWAYWSSTGAATGAASTATLNPPGVPVASVAPGAASVALTWSAPVGLAPQGYYVMRTRTSDGATAPGCASSPAQLVSGPCTDSAVPAGSYRYTVTAVLRSWTSTSPGSNIVVVVPDVTAPVVSVTSVNGTTRAFPYLTGASIASIGGECGMAPGDSATVSPRIDGDPTTPAASPCTAGSWSLTLSTPLSTVGTHTVGVTQDDAAGNTGVAPTTLVIIDATAPTVTSITRAGPVQSVNSGPLTWTVTFSEPVSGAVPASFTLTRSSLSGATPSVTGVIPGGIAPSSTWTVTVGTVGVYGADNGSIRLDLTSNAGIRDTAGNLLVAGSFTGEAYDYDTTRPTVLSLVRAGSNAVVNTGPLVWTVTFSEKVRSVAVGNFSLSTSGLGGATMPSISAVSAVGGGASSATWTVSVATTGTTGGNAAWIGLSLTTAGITDAASNTISASSVAGPTYGYDTSPPVVIGVTSSLANGIYRAGQVVPVTVTFNELVSVTGTPQLRLATGTPAATPVDYVSGSGSTVLRFDYTVAAGNTSSDLDYAATTPLILNGGTIGDVATNSAVLTLAAPGATGSLGAAKALVIDTTAPAVAVTQVGGSPATFPYFTKSTVNSVGGTCGTAATDVATVGVVVTTGGSTTTTNVACTMAGGWSLSSLSWSSSATRIVSAAQSDQAGNTGTAPEQEVTVDKLAPTVLGVSSPLADGSYRAGQVVPVTVEFSEPVTVTGTPRLTLSTGSPTTTIAPYTSGSATSTLTFTYTVGPNNTSADLNYAATSSLTLNGGTIADLAGNAATRTLPGLNSAGSLASSKNLVIDNTSPTVTSITSALANGSYRAGQVVPVEVTFSEPVVVTGTPALQLATGTPATTSVGYSSGSGSTTLTFDYTVADGNTSADLDYANTGALVLNGGTITDAAGNDAVRTLPAPGTAGSLGANKALVIDTTPPVVTVTSIQRVFPIFIYPVTASGTAESDDGPVTVFLCFNGGPTCDASTATQTFTVSGASWTTGWSSQLGRGTWYASAEQTDAAGNVGTSPVFGPFNS